MAKSEASSWEGARKWRHRAGIPLSIMVVMSIVLVCLSRFIRVGYGPLTLGDAGAIFLTLTAAIYGPVTILAVTHYTVRGWKAAAHDRIYRLQGQVSVALAWLACAIFVFYFTYLIVWSNQVELRDDGTYIVDPEKLITVQTDFLCNFVGLLTLGSLSTGLFSEPGDGSAPRRQPES